MKASSQKALSTLSTMKGSGPHLTTESLQTLGGETASFPFGRRPTTGCVSEKPGHKFGQWTLLDSRIYRDNWSTKFVSVRCQCGIHQLNNYNMMKSGGSTGCIPCQKERLKSPAPKWLMTRLYAAHSRCTNPATKNYRHYGGRGIQFKFKSVLEAAKWIVENMGLQEEMELDRNRNMGHYEPGNIRWVTRQRNMVNTRVTKVPKDFAFIAADWPYCQFKVHRFLGAGMTRKQILARAKNSIREKRKGWRRMQEWFKRTTS